MFIYQIIKMTNKFKKYFNNKIIMDLNNIFYINLEERKDRKLHVECQLNKLGWNYERFTGIKTKNGNVGCSLSHLKLIKMAKEKKLPYIVIVEDDIEFKNVKLFKKLLNEFFEKNMEYDVYLLAGNLREVEKTEHKNILRAMRSYTTTGYVVKQHYYDKIIENISKGVMLLLKDASNGMFAIDTHLMRLQKKDKWYISIPRTVSQRADYSSIEEKEVNYDHVMLDKF